jgi:HAD superfamily hydrolase (TIGR01459 family)
MKRLGGIAELVPLYDAFIIDQFGTLHDGYALYPGAEAALRRLRAAGRRVLLLSNSGKRGIDNVRRMARLGIAPDAYEACLTSGEVAWHLLVQGRIEVARDHRRCLLLERDGDGTLLDGTGLTAGPPEQAELVVIAGSEGDRRTLDDYAALLAPLARRGLPALCVNPDRTMLTPSGPTFGAGRIAELYQGFGGTVTWVGKPYPEVYVAALAALDHPAPERVACIGDSVEHDVAGAHAAGCAGWLVHAGIIAGAADTEIDAECRRYGVTPDGMLNAFA